MIRFHVRYLPSILLNLGTVYYPPDDMFNDGKNNIFAPIGLFYNDFLDYSQKNMTIYAYTSFPYYLGNRQISSGYCIRETTASHAHLAVSNGTSNSNYKKTNWSSHNFTTSNMHTFATEFGNCIKINYKSSGVPFNLSEDLNLILFSGYARDFETGNNTSDEYIVPIVYEGNDPNADEIIEV